MKKLLSLIALCAVLAVGDLHAQDKTYQYLQISAVESVVPMGLGRSRLITTSKDGQMLEKELKNFFSATGINFGNIQNNDRVIAERINELEKEGWSLYLINSGVYAADKSTGLFITRYIFRKEIK
jgi:hypothetical protein